jgi:hypothetical protein
MKFSAERMISVHIGNGMILAMFLQGRENGDNKMVIDKKE